MAKIPATAEWGRQTAKGRYGSVHDSPVSPAPTQQPPQDIEDKHGDTYDNDAAGWVRGVREGPPIGKHEDGTNRPGFDKNHRSGG